MIALIIYVLNLSYRICHFMHSLKSLLYRITLSCTHDSLVIVIYITHQFIMVSTIYVLYIAENRDEDPLPSSLLAINGDADSFFGLNIQH